MENLYDMSEEDIKLNFITPSIMDKGWGYDNIWYNGQKGCYFLDVCF